MMKKILYGLGGLALGLYLAGFFLPDEVIVQRQVQIDAPREKVFALVSDFNAWDKWSPWKEMDPNAVFAVDGAGIGHRMVWESDHEKVQDGSQTIVTYDPPRMVESRYNLGAWGGGYGVFVLVERDGGTYVTWAFNTSMRQGKAPWEAPIHAWYGLFMDENLGPTYERGLERLKEVAEQ
jgi:uncharacterized protein YndB with AHSA1/START domain